MPFFPQPLDLVPSIPEEDVSLLLVLEVPRRDEDHIALPDPVPLLHLAADPAHSLVSVLTNDPHTRSSEVLIDDSQYVVLVGHEHSLPDVALRLD